MSGPAAPRRPSRVTFHGDSREDPYAWLKVPNWQEVMREPALLDPEVRAVLVAENEHTDAFMKPHEALMSTLFDEMRGRIQEDDATAPAPDGAWAYYVRFEAGGQHPIHARCPRLDVDRSREQVLIHGDREAVGKPYWKLEAAEHSPDHRFLAYATDTKGSELFDLRFRDLDRGADLPDVIPGTHGHFEWANDGQTVFYTVLDDHHRPSKVFRHMLGSDIADDVLVYEEPDPGFFVGVTKTESGAVHPHRYP
ncbi:MAG: hypothetical protein HC923_01250 [Myxococcales bacterium]|nr:hypothetical protein [Myxococcales bacterium]